MKPSKTDIVAKRMKVTGLVQGVGFRPFIYRLASQLNLKGYVYNQSDCVVVKIQGTSDKLSDFKNKLYKEKPQAAEIRSLSSENDMLEDLENFEIIASREGEDFISDISPDIAVCPDCLRDMKKQEHRLNYPFINCTACGPRFTIIRGYPYDRVNTTMSDFPMCEQCSKEYHTILDRRFHAQPVACNHCGPEYRLHTKNNRVENFNEILIQTCDIINHGSVVAVKGLGGYHLMCDATNREAVDKIRDIKKRDTKPFAVMFKNMDAIENYCHTSEAEKKELTSWRRPIVILPAKDQKTAEGVTSGFSTIGAFLPYLPLHYLLFEHILTDAIVLTSGNISDEPIITDNQLALDTFLPVCDAVLTNNRDIHNRADDSVIKFIHHQPSIFRRARGFVPNPIETGMSCEGILATGAELVNAFCLGKKNQAIMSQYIGDLKNYETYEFFLEAIHTFKKLFRFKPEILAADLHPDYLATQYAREQNLPVIEVQHHHAHIASCMAENHLDEPVIGISFDGTGLGTDNKIWGSEFMVADYRKFERLFHFEYIPIPGGDLATKQPWRTAISYLHRYYGNDLTSLDIPFLKGMNNKEVKQITEAIDKQINSPESCSAGRLFDAVSVILNGLTTAKFHAEAPMRLEDMVESEITDFYPFAVDGQVISFKPVFDGILKDLFNKTNPAVIAAKFHNTAGHVICDMALRIRKESGINKLALSGGTFQNKYLIEMLFPMLEDANFEVFYHRKVSCNDGGIALGQLVIASKLK